MENETSVGAMCEQVTCEICKILLLQSYDLEFYFFLGFVEGFEIVQ